MDGEVTSAPPLRDAGRTEGHGSWRQLQNRLRVSRRCWRQRRDWHRATIRPVTSPISIHFQSISISICHHSRHQPSPVAAPMTDRHRVCAAGHRQTAAGGHTLHLPPPAEDCTQPPGQEENVAWLTKMMSASSQLRPSLIHDCLVMSLQDGSSRPTGSHVGLF